MQRSNAARALQQERIGGREAPIHAGAAVLGKKAIGAAEGLAAEPAVIGRERAGMGRVENAMAAAMQGGDAGRGLAGVVAPEQKGAGLWAGGHCGKAGIGDGLPTGPRVGTCAALLHAERGVEQKHALARPCGKIAMGGRRMAQIGL